MSENHSHPERVNIFSDRDRERKNERDEREREGVSSSSKTAFLHNPLNSDFFFLKLWEGEIETFRVVYTCFGLIYVNIRPLG